MSLFKSFSTYTIASFIEKGIAFFLLPVFTFYLSPKDYGTLSLLQSIYSLILPVISLGSMGAISVAYFNKGESNYSSYFSSCLIPPIAVTIVLTILSSCGYSFLGSYFQISPIWIIIIPSFCFLTVFNSLLLTDYQIKNQPLNYVKYSLSNSTLSVLLSLLFVISIHLSFKGRLYGQYISVFVFFIIALFILLKKGIISINAINKDDIIDSIKFGLPLIPHTLGCMVINMSDRLFIDKLLGKDILGLYNTGYIIGGSISILCGAFANAIIPFSYSLFELNTLDAKKKVVKVYWIFILLLIGVVLLVWLFTPFVFRFLINEKFSDGQKYVIWITLGYFFQGLYLLFANIIFYLKKTKILFYWSFVNVILNIALNFVLIREFGAIGAAYTLCLSYFIFFFAIATITSKLYPLPWFSALIEK